MANSQWSTTVDFTTKSSFIPNAEEAIISASDKVTNDYLGSSVSIDNTGTRIIVGARGGDPGGLSAAGKAYIFTRSGTSWTQSAILTASNKAADTYFGASVHMTETRAIVGSHYAAAGGITQAGSAYIFA